jgi:EmrB/QacA subfamily drug resistance transporter
MVNNQDKKYIFLAVMLTSGSGPLMLSAVNVALPSIASDLSMNPVQLSWVTLALTLTLVMFTIPFGRLADIIGRKKIYTIGLVIFAASTLCLALGNSPTMIISVRLIQGISLAMIWGTGVALLTAAYPANERGRVLGLSVAAVFLGASIGPTLGGLLTQYLGWRSIFYFTLIPQIPALVVLFMKVKRDAVVANKEPYDIPGSILYAITLFSIVYGFSLLPESVGAWIIAFGIIMLIVFIFWELRIESPLFNIHHFTKNRLFAFSSLTQLVFHCSIFPISFILSLYLQYVKGLGPQDAGFILLAQPAMQAIFSPLVGRLSDRIQPRILATSGVVVALVGLLLLLSADEDASIMLYIISQILIGLGCAFFATPNTHSIMSAIDHKYYGVASAVQATSRDIGITLGMSIMTLFFSLYLGSAAITPDNYSTFVESIRGAYVVFSIIGFAGIIVSLARGKRITST